MEIKRTEPLVSTENHDLNNTIPPSQSSDQLNDKNKDHFYIIEDLHNDSGQMLNNSFKLKDHHIIDKEDTHSVSDDQNTENMSQEIGEVKRMNEEGKLKNHNDNKKENYDDDKKVNKDEDNKKGKICLFFQKRSCKHGLKGKQCKFYHPQLCNKYTNHGTNSKIGCNLGKNCKNFHPKMCSTSIIKGECFQQGC